MEIFIGPAPLIAATRRGTLESELEVSFRECFAAPGDRFGPRLLTEGMQMSTNYNRYLDIHLCTSHDIAAVKTKKMQKARDTGSYNALVKCARNFFTANGTEYFYEFHADMEDQVRYRTGKSEGFTYDSDAVFFNTGNCRNYTDVEITTANKSMLVCRNGEISDELKQMRYIGCMASIEQLAAPHVYPNLEGLVRWISDATTTNKLRINCHGAGTSTDGFLMGNTQLSEQALVDALVRHGLTRQDKGKQNTFGLAHAARWKLDSEVSRCENATCGQQFSKTWYGSSTKHHCRRCGGIFCDKCSSKRIDLRVALTGPNNATTNNARNARVCNTCFNEAFDVEHKFGGDLVLQEVFGRDAAGGELKYGLQTIALGLCMGARDNDGFSPELADAAAGTLQAGSLAGRLRGELTRRGLRGIKITASNTVVANSALTGLVNSFGVKYPNAGGHRAMGLERQGSFSFPAYIWGSSDTKRTEYEQLADPKPAPGIEVHGGTIRFGYGAPLPPPLLPAAAPRRRLRVAAGAGAAMSPVETVLRYFLQDWRFDSWLEVAPRAGVAAHDCYFVFKPPPRVSTIQGVPNPPTLRAPYGSVITVTGTQVDTFKLTKAHGFS